MSSMLSNADSGSGRPLRVVQWATGNIGSRALQQVIGHPHLELVGLYAHSAEKAGRDAGELCGLGPTGVLATNDVDDIIALGADCVLYMPRTTDVDVLCRLLAAGTNVVSTCGVFHHPPSMDAEVRARVEAACAQGGASVHSTGSSPGFITEAGAAAGAVEPRRHPSAQAASTRARTSASMLDGGGETPRASRHDVGAGRQQPAQPVRWCGAVFCTRRRRRGR